MSHLLRINEFVVRDDSDCLIIAEIGHNHQGSLDKAIEMFETAAKCGVDAVKLQKRDNKSLFSAELYNSPYDNENSFGKTYGEHREFLEFGEKEYSILKDKAQQLGVLFMATAFDFVSADFLEKINVDAYKVASGDLKNTPLLEYIARKGKPVILSTGGGTMEDVRRAYSTIKPLNSNFAILQCTASYPAEPEEMNLRVIKTFRHEFSDIVIGLSDHQNGIALSVLAYALGARIIEKHFTLNRSSKGTDHSFSLEPTGMQKLVRDLRRAKVALGDGIKKPLSCEEEPLYKMGKRLVAASFLSRGHVISIDDILIQSPGGDIPPCEIAQLINKKLLVDMEKEQAFAWDCIEG